jgi:hypothetical protein
MVGDKPFQAMRSIRRLLKDITLRKPTTTDSKISLLKKKRIIMKEWDYQE